MQFQFVKPVINLEPVMDTALSYFNEVVRLGSIRQAAERLHVSASSISRQIQKLEHMFGTELIVRHPQGVKLTPAGEVVARFIQGRAREMQRVKTSIDALKGLHSGHVCIYTVEGMIGGLLPRALDAFCRQYPGITYEVCVAGTDDVMQAVAEDRCDIGISFHPFPRHNVVALATIQQPLHAVMAPNHPMAGRKVLAFSDLVAEPIGLPDPSFGIRHLVDHVLKSGQFDVNIRLETNSIDMLRQFAVHEMGVVFMPAFACERELATKQLVSVPLADAALTKAKAHICKHAEIEPTLAAQGLVQTIVSLASDHGDVAIFATLRAEVNAS